MRAGSLDHDNVRACFAQRADRGEQQPRRLETRSS
jgi:hypothetical protein